MRHSASQRCTYHAVHVAQSFSRETTVHSFRCVRREIERKVSFVARRARKGLAHRVRGASPRKSFEDTGDKLLVPHEITSSLPREKQKQIGKKAERRNFVMRRHTRRFICVLSFAGSKVAQCFCLWSYFMLKVVERAAIRRRKYGEVRVSHSKYVSQFSSTHLRIRNFK